MDKSKWVAIEFQAEVQDEELAAWLMMTQGAQGCEIIASENTTATVKAIFDKNKMDGRFDGIKSMLNEYNLAYCIKSLRTSDIAEQDWTIEWKKGLKPFSVGYKLLICPPWLEHTLSEKEIFGKQLLLIEPGMAFGTGLHATTQYCLKTLENVEVGEDVLDIGTGSGILAIATAKLYPDVRISAADIQADAIKTAQENLQLNGVADRIKLFEGSTEIFDNQSFDCILSNLTCEDIISLLLDFLRLLRPNGTIICAGILSEKVPLLERAIESYPLSIVDRQSGLGWTGVTLQRIAVELRAR